MTVVDNGIYYLKKEDQYISEVKSNTIAGVLFFVFWLNIYPNKHIAAIYDKSLTFAADLFIKQKIHTVYYGKYSRH